MYDWKIKRHPPKNDFSRCCGFSFRKSYASGLAICGSHTSLRSSVSSHPASPLFLGLKKLISIPNRGKQPSLEKRLTPFPYSLKKLYLMYDWKIKRHPSKNDFGPVPQEQIRPVEFLGGCLFIYRKNDIKILFF